MKNLKLGISALAITIASTVFAQTSNNPWAIGVGAHGVNHMAVANGPIGDKFNNFDRLFEMGNYEITPPLSKLTVARHLAGPLVLDWQTSVGNVPNARFGMGKEFMLMTGLGLQLKANRLWNEESWFDPYLRVGASYLRHDYTGLTFPRTDAANDNVSLPFDNEGGLPKANYFAVPVGIGSNFWITKNFGLGLQGDYVSTPGNKESNIANFWQASASLMFRFGQRDRDKDGILDKDDKCPDTPGLEEFQGCPDTDGDGIADGDDQCPNEAGPVENNGCPWPDTDGDGLVDNQDNCPNEAGPTENNGCPWPDTDGDGILDKDDNCPNEYGLAEYQGCPKPKKVIEDAIDMTLKNVYFDFNKSSIRPDSNAALDAAVNIINKEGGRFLLTGETDAKGSDAANLELSQRRAAAVVAALEAKGVDANSLKSMGVGERNAKVPESASDAERQKDRKVVVKYIADDSEWNSIQKSDVVEKAKKVIKKVAPKKKK